VDFSLLINGGLGVGRMAKPATRVFGPAAELLLVASDPRVIAAAEAAARHLGRPPPLRITDASVALARLLGPGAAPSHLLCERGAVVAGPGWPGLLAAASDPFQPTDLIVIAPPAGLDALLPSDIRAVPADPREIAAALRARGAEGLGNPTDPAALALGLSLGEITVRFQPVVRVRDRRLVMVEALARWERPQREAISPAQFVPMAESHGLASALTATVAFRAMQELAPVQRRLPMRLSFNVPLSVLLEPELGAGLRRRIAGSGFRPGDLMLELTESIEVRDRSLLLRALRRLGRDGFGVMLDDVGMDDDRLPLLGLPFVGVKLDRSLVGLLPRCRRARAQVMRIAAAARAQGQRVVAEGVADAAAWRIVAALGVTDVQGFGVGRPMPAGALEHWARAWSGHQRLLA
jgi:EAL domain-containing protein (putative c-di-GMP-specific phosphodiesterase class I)